MCLANPVVGKNVPYRVVATRRGVASVADIERPHPNPMGSPITVFDLKLSRKKGGVDA